VCSERRDSRGRLAGVETRGPLVRAVRRVARDIQATVVQLALLDPRARPGLLARKDQSGRPERRE